MKTGKVHYLSDLHFDHTQWRSELAFWEYEIKFMERQLAEIVDQTHRKAVLARAEHFQNAFIVHRDEMSVIRHKIGWHEELLSRVAKLQPADIERKYFQDHTAIRTRLDNQRRIFRQLKDEFFEFLHEENSVDVTA